MAPVVLVILTCFGVLWLAIASWTLIGYCFLNSECHGCMFDSSQKNRFRKMFFFFFKLIFIVTDQILTHRFSKLFKGHLLHIWLSAKPRTGVTELQYFLLKPYLALWFVYNCLHFIFLVRYDLVHNSWVYIILLLLQSSETEYCRTIRHSISNVNFVLLFYYWNLCTRALLNSHAILMTLQTINFTRIIN